MSDINIAQNAASVAAKAPNGPAKIEAIIARMRRPEPGSLNNAPPPREWLLKDPEDRGFIPLGEVGYLIGGGGSSKTFAALGLGISVVTGRDWFGTYTSPATGGAALFLAEESADECQRRLYHVAQELKLTPEERRAVESGILVAPLKGLQTPLVASGAGSDTDVTKALFDRLKEEADETAKPWRLIVFDSLSRFGAADTETQNAAAAAFVAVAEKFTYLPGRPTVIVIHHTSQGSRTPGLAPSASAARGVTALVDNARFAMSLTPDEETGLVGLRLVKSNYAVGYPGQPELMLARSAQGALTAATVDQIDQAEAGGKADKRQKQVDDTNAREFAIMREVTKHPGRHTSKNALYEAVGGTKQKVLGAIDNLVNSGRLLSPTDNEGYRVP